MSSIINEPNVPRVFRLLSELDEGNRVSLLYSYGLERGKTYLLILEDDNTFTYWKAFFLGPNERIYELKLICGEDYPENPPKIRFVTKIKMPAVNQTTGWVDIAQLAYLESWTKINTISNVLEAIRKETKTQTFNKLIQPEESAVFP